MNDVRAQIFAGSVALPTVGEVLYAGEHNTPPFVVTIGGTELSVVTSFLTDLTVSDMRASTVRSYAYDVLRWWRVLIAVGVRWDQATRAETELMVGWFRSAPNPQRMRRHDAVTPPGSVNVRTGKPVLGTGYAPATINHALTVVSAFYGFHAERGHGPVSNPVPGPADRRRMLLRPSPFDTTFRPRRAPLRQRQSRRGPRSIPDRMWDELVAAMTHDRDRAILSLAVSSGARASELLGVVGGRVDWGMRRVWVVGKGTDDLVAVPGSPDAFVDLARYYDRCGVPGANEHIWRTTRGVPRPLTYWALRRVLQRANDALATNWTFHDIRHTAACRMADDPNLTLPEVQAVLRHRHITTTQAYLVPRVEQLHDKLQEHYGRPRTSETFAAEYAAEDLRTVFGE